MKKYNPTVIIISACLFLLSNVVQAQTPAFAKDGGATNNSTFCLGATSSCKKVQLLYLPSDFSSLPPSGTITTIYFMYGSTGITLDYIISNLTIKMGQTPNSGFVNGTDFYSGLTTVLSEPTYTIPAGIQGNWFPITLTTPFSYNNAQTLIVETTLDNATVTNFGLFCGATLANQKLYSASTVAATGTANSNLQNFGMAINTANCSGQPIAGTAIALDTSFCSGNSTTISLSGYTTDAGITFQWKESLVPGGPYSNVTGGTGATSASYTTPQLTSTTYYICEVTCTFSSQSALSTEAVVNVVNPQVASTTPATRCGAGTLTLGAIAGPGANTLNWYWTPTGGQPIGTGTSFTTPVITQTTDFYVGAAIGAASNDSLLIPISSGTTSGIYHHMFTVTASTDINLTGLGIKILAAIGTLTNWQIYYRPDNYNLTPGSNTSSAGWTLLTTANNIVSNGNTTYTNIVMGQSLNIPSGSTYSFYVAPLDAASTHQYITPGNGLIAATNADLTIRGGNRGSSLFNCSTSGGCPTLRVYYNTGCEGVRTPVTATVTPSDPVTIQAGANALCLGQSTTLTAVSNNSNYTYQWSPSTGLSGSTGSSVTAQPTTTITYTVYGNDGTCGALDSITISVGPPSVSGVASISSDTSCSGNPVILMLSGSVGSIQWQSNTGSGWVNETGTGSDSASYTVNPTISTSYQAIVTSGGCASATSSVVSVHVVTITDPVTTDDTICEGDTAMLTATGTGVINWFTSSSGGTPVASGPTYSPVVTTTTTFYAQSAAGSTYHVGAPHAGIGAQNMSSSANYGLSFDVQAQSVIEKVTIEPAQTGSVIINLRQVQNGTILNTVTVPVTAFIQAQPTLGFIVNPGTGYRLELGAGSVSCYYNSSGATYPYITAGSPLSITGYLNPNPNTGAAYYYFYNWQVSQGCASNLIPATVTVNPAPPVPIITQNGNQLTSSSSVNNQWYQNGNQLPGATGQVYNATQPGSYTVVVTDPATGCSSESQPVVIVGIQEVDQTGGMLIRVYPNPSTGLILLTTTQPGSTISRISVQDLSGRVLNEQLLEGLHRTAQLELELPPSSGLYILEVQTGEQKTMVKVVKE
ncbi:MAG: T9SS type A sorting domain-containing protein [Bacteroidia bacterium]|nr:T9SS type A sorting domain-containing protein [Bacteroidia bacterium]